MTRNLIASSIATILAAAMTTPSSAAERQLTIYSGDFDSVSQSEAQSGGPGFALVESRIAFNLKAGDNMVTLGGLPQALDASSVMLKPSNAGTRVRGQRFDFAVAGQDELLRRALGQTVSVEQAVGDARQTYTGTLISAGNGLTLRLADGRIKVLSGYSSFELPRLPDGVVNEPTMNWSIASDRAGMQDFGLNYSTAGLAWRAEYNVNANGIGKDCKMSLEGAAMVVNRSGADFNDVMLTLVAGEPRRVPGSSPKVMEFGRAAAAPMMADSAVAPQASGEYQAYKLPNAGSLPQGSVQRLPLVNPASGIACERRYETSSQMGEWRPPYPIVDENYGAGEGQQQAVLATLRFKNSKAVGLGIPLPAGRVRMFDGNDFLGEAQLGHTAANQDVALQIGDVFDLKAERTRENFQLDRNGRTMTETVKLVLRNSKPGAATVRVNEQLPRWTDWEIVSSSVPHEKRSAQRVSFDVAVPADGEVELRYTVRYRWAPDIKLP